MTGAGWQVPSGTCDWLKKTRQWTPVIWVDASRRTELLLAWVLSAGVAAAGAYDFADAVAPRGVFDTPSVVALALFFAFCLLTAMLASALARLEPGTNRSKLRVALLVASLMPPVVADPTYASLLLAIVLCDLRRRDSEPLRTVGTLAICGVIALLVLTERTPGGSAENEARIGLAIAFFLIIMFGDALRRLDEGLVTETRLAQLTERSRLSSELHDSVGHHLLASSIQLQKAKALETRAPDAASQAVELAARAVADAISESRMIVDATKHDQEFRIEPALRDLTRRIAPSGTTVVVNTEGDYGRVGQPTQVAMYRIAQEALSNLVRHSSASSARIASWVNPDAVVLEIVDDGSGFDVTSDTSAPGGLQNMRRRVAELGGTFEITSSPSGTSILATVPL